MSQIGNNYCFIIIMLFNVIYRCNGPYNQFITPPLAVVTASCENLLIDMRCRNAII